MTVAAGEESQQGQEVQPELRDRMQRLLDSCEISNVHVTEFSAKRFGVEASPPKINVTNEVSFFVSSVAFANRYVWEVELLDESGAVVAELSATVVVDYEVQDGFEPDEEAAGMIAESTGFFAAYPYVRELLQANTSRLQLNPVVLGLLMKGDQKPRGA